MTTNDASTDYAPRRHAATDSVKVGRDPMVHVHRARVGDSLKALFDQLDQLGARLSPVLVYEDEATSATVRAIEVAPPQSDVAGHLDGFANDLNTACLRLSDLIRHLDI